MLYSDYLPIVVAFLKVVLREFGYKLDQLTSPLKIPYTLYRTIVLIVIGINEFPFHLKTVSIL